MTEVKSGPAFAKCRNSALAAVMRRNAALAQDYARRHGVPRWYADAAQLIGDPEVDAVYIATPPASHLEYALACAQAGKPLYLEKPMAGSYADSARIVQAFRQAGVPLYVAFYRRGLEYFQRIRQLLAQGAIGPVHTVEVRQIMATRPDDAGPGQDWRVKPEIAGAGRFYDLGCHTLDILDYLLGPLAACGGARANRAGLYPAEDTVCAWLNFQCGALGTGLWSFCADRDEESVTLNGAKGYLRFSVYTMGSFWLGGPGGEREYTVPAPPHVQQPLIQTVVDELAGQGQCPSTGSSALRTMWALDRILGRV